MVLIWIIYLENEGSLDDVSLIRTVFSISENLPNWKFKNSTNYVIITLQSRIIEHFENICKLLDMGSSGLNC